MSFDKKFSYYTPKKNGKGVRKICLCASYPFPHRAYSGKCELHEIEGAAQYYNLCDSDIAFSLEWGGPTDPQGNQDWYEIAKEIANDHSEMMWVTQDWYSM